VCLDLLLFASAENGSTFSPVDFECLVWSKCQLSCVALAHRQTAGMEVKCGLWHPQRWCRLKTQATVPNSERVLLLKWKHISYLTIVMERG
jgi:hypothetical protein